MSIAFPEPIIDGGEMVITETGEFIEPVEPDLIQVMENSRIIETTTDFSVEEVQKANEITPIDSSQYIIDATKLNIYNLAQIGAVSYVINNLILGDETQRFSLTSIFTNIRNALITENTRILQNINLHTLVEAGRLDISALDIFQESVVGQSISILRNLHNRDTRIRFRRETFGSSAMRVYEAIRNEPRRAWENIIANIISPEVSRIVFRGDIGLSMFEQNRIDEVIGITSILYARVFESTVEDVMQTDLNNVGYFDAFLSLMSLVRNNAYPIASIAYLLFSVIGVSTPFDFGMYRLISFLLNYIAGVPLTFLTQMFDFALSFLGVDIFDLVNVHIKAFTLLAQQFADVNENNLAQKVFKSIPVVKFWLSGEGGTEKHLRTMESSLNPRNQVGFTKGSYNFCGPNTRLDLRTIPNTKDKFGLPMSVPNSPPINLLDVGCKMHDFATKASPESQIKADNALIKYIDKHILKNPNITISEKLDGKLVKNIMKIKLKVVLGQDVNVIPKNIENEIVKEVFKMENPKFDYDILNKSSTKQLNKDFDISYPPLPPPPPPPPAFPPTILKPSDFSKKSDRPPRPFISRPKSFLLDDPQYKEFLDDEEINLETDIPVISNKPDFTPGIKSTKESKKLNLQMLSILYALLGDNKKKKKKRKSPKQIKVIINKIKNLMLKFDFVPTNF
jgi:hypothetical protein